MQGCQKSDFVSSTETKACFHSRSSKVAHLNGLIEIWEELLRKCLCYLRELKFCLFVFDWVLWSHNPLLFQRLFWLLVSHKFCPVEAAFSASKCQLGFIRVEFRCSVLENGNTKITEIITEEEEGQVRHRGFLPTEIITEEETHQVRHRGFLPKYQRKEIWKRLPE